MTPRLSAIMPTADRRRFVPAAIAQFLAQHRDDAELVIVDDGADSIADLIPGDPRIRYYREETRRIIGDKRNRLCQLARGEIIVHWDDDDWHAPDRLARQVAALEASGAAICGCDRVIFLAADGSEAWDYAYGGNRPWVAGGSMCYRRAYWQQHRFAHLRAGEDTQWVFAARREAVHAMGDNSFLVARVHAANTSPKQTRGAWWHPRDPSPVLALMARSPGESMDRDKQNSMSASARFPSIPELLPAQFCAASAPSALATSILPLSRLRTLTAGP